MRWQSQNRWSKSLAFVAFSLLVFNLAWAGEPENKPAPNAQERRGGIFFRFMKGVARPSGGATTKAAMGNSLRRGAGRQLSGGSTTPEDYVIGPGDVLTINVWQEPQISRSVIVRPDGRISLPLAGHLEASGLSPIKLQTKIMESLKPFLSNPEVTVMVDKVELPKFNILGEVFRPGSYDLMKGTSVLDAIALAGGFRDFAKVKDIYVLRRTGNESSVRLSFNYKEVTKGKKLSQNIELEPGDTIVVP